MEAVWRCTTSHHGPRRYVAKITRVFGEVDTAYWFEGSAVAPTVRNVVDHARLMLTVDLSYPVILGHD